MTSPADAELPPARPWRRSRLLNVWVDDLTMQQLMQRLTPAPRAAPIFSLHAKALVVDGKAAYIGTFNFDPRSQNLNTEVGVIVRDEAVAGAVEAAIETDMAPDNSWNAATDDPDQHASLAKRGKVRVYQWLPLKPLL